MDGVESALGALSPEDVAKLQEEEKEKLKGTTKHLF